MMTLQERYEAAVAALRTISQEGREGNGGRSDYDQGLNEGRRWSGQIAEGTLKTIGERLER